MGFLLMLNAIFTHKLELIYFALFIYNIVNN